MKRTLFALVLFAAVFVVFPASAGVRLVNPPSVEGVLVANVSPVGRTYSSEGWSSGEYPVTLYGCEQESSSDIQDVRVVAQLPVRPAGTMLVGVRQDGVVVYYA